MLSFEIEKKGYVSKVTGEKKTAFNISMVINGVKSPLTIKGETSTLLIVHQLMEQCDELKNLDEKKSLLFIEA